MATEGLGFKDFIRRAQVKAQYREMLRLARRYARARPAAGADVLRQVRDGYRRHASERDGFAVAQLISDGRTKLRELRALAAGDGSLPPPQMRETLGAAVSLLLETAAWACSPLAAAECRAGLQSALKRLTPQCDANRSKFSDVMATAQQFQAILCGVGEGGRRLH